MGDRIQDKKVMDAYRRFKHALSTLHETVSDSEINNPYLQDATIKRFEYTYETAWKAIKFVLEGKGIYEIYPADLFREAFTAGWILEPEVFRDMIVSRNITSHQYAEYKAEELNNKVCNTYYPELRYLQIQLEGAIYGDT